MSGRRHAPHALRQGRRNAAANDGKVQNSVRSGHFSLLLAGCRLAAGSLVAVGYGPYMRFSPVMPHAPCIWQQIFRDLHHEDRPRVNTALANDAAEMRKATLSTLLADPARGRGLVWQMEDLRIDLSRQFVTPAVMKNLQALARAESLADRIAALFAGAPVNVSEGRAVVHMAQRAAERITSAAFARLSDFAESVRQSDVADVINIGIGGSDLGRQWSAPRWRIWPAVRACIMSPMSIRRICMMCCAAAIRPARWSL